MNYKVLVKVLREHGFVYIRSNKHHIYSNGIKSVAIPKKKIINFMLVKTIMKQINS